MRAGKLRHRIEIQQETETKDSYGQPIRTWTTVKTRWASIKSLTSREYINAQAAGSDTTHEVEMRQYAPLTPEYRCKYGDLIYNITSVIHSHDGTDPMTTALAKETTT